MSKAVCTWTRTQHWPTGNTSTLFLPGCKQYKRSSLSRGWNFCPFCGGQLEAPAGSEHLMQPDPQEGTP